MSDGEVAAGRTNFSEESGPPRSLIFELHAHETALATAGFSPCSSTLLGPLPGSQPLAEHLANSLQEKVAAE
jgi:hypothetical protein